MERPLFGDVTGAVFEGVSSFAAQLSRGVPYWVASVDPASGIDIYGNNGLAVGDMDNDGIDELFVCQPGGLPNRLYKFVNGKFVDVSAKAGIDLLDTTSSALFLDLRNVGLQDLVVLLTTGPVLFLNNGDGTFRLREDAFEFASPPQGTFTGMAAADYDCDGKLDLYFCSYLFFQSEAQYRYPVPYHDAQNGPPNYPFRNRIDAAGKGRFVDVTIESGINQNNNRFSFAAAWCDYLLIDEKGRDRKIYASQPSAKEVQADIRSVGKPLPFEGRYVVRPRRDFFKLGAALFSTGYPEQALPYLEAVPSVKRMCGRWCSLLKSILMPATLRTPANC